MTEPTKTTHSDGTQYWYLYGKFHREDGPAITRPDGTQAWYLYGKLHRVNGPAVTYGDGKQVWWLDGELHREDGPAIIYPSGGQEWWRNGDPHREDGPACIYANGRQDWYLDGKLMSEHEHAATVAKLAKGASEMQERLHALHDEIDCLKYEAEKAAADERAKIVAWLREPGWERTFELEAIIKDIEAGDHLK